MYPRWIPLFQETQTMRLEGRLRGKRAHGNFTMELLLFLRFVYRTYRLSC